MEGRLPARQVPVDRELLPVHEAPSGPRTTPSIDRARNIAASSRGGVGIPHLSQRDTCPGADTRAVCCPRTSPSSRISPRESASGWAACQSSTIESSAIVVRVREARPVPRTRGPDTSGPRSTGSAPSLMAPNPTPAPICGAPVRGVPARAPARAGLSSTRQKRTQCRGTEHREEPARPHRGLRDESPPTARSNDEDAYPPSGGGNPAARARRPTIGRSHLPRDHRQRRNSTRSDFSGAESLSPRTRLKNSTVSSMVSRRSSWR